MTGKNRNARLAVSVALKLADELDARYFFQDTRRHIIQGAGYLRLADLHLKENTTDVSTVLTEGVLGNLNEALGIYSARSEAGNEALMTRADRLFKVERLQEVLTSVQAWVEAPDAKTWPPLYRKSLADLKRLSDSLLKLENGNAWTYFCCGN